MADEHHNAHNDVDDAHERHQLFGDAAYALYAAQKNDGDEQGYRPYIYRKGEPFVYSRIDHKQDKSRTCNADYAPDELLPAPACRIEDR